MGRREPTQLSRLLRALGILVAILLLFDGRILSLWSHSIKDLRGRALFSGIVDPVSRLAGLHGLSRPEAGMGAAFKLALAGSSDGSSLRLGAAAPGASPAAAEGLKAAWLRIFAPPEASEAPSPRSTPAPEPARKSIADAEGRVQAAPGVYYAPYYRSFSFPAPPGAAPSREVSAAPLSLLFIGDSLMGSLALSLKKAAPMHPECSIRLEYGISSSIVQSVYCDWQKRLDDLLSESGYDCVIVFLGANDGVGMSSGGVDMAFDGEAWRAEYQARVRRLLASMQGKAKRIYWLGTPPMLKKAYGEKMERINDLVAKSCAEFPEARYLDLDPLLGDEKGEYRAAMYLDGELKALRTEDGIHFTQAGAKLITDYVFAELNLDFGAPGSGTAATPPPYAGLSWGSAPSPSPSP